MRSRVLVSTIPFGLEVNFFPYRVLGFIQNNVGTS